MLARADEVDAVSRFALNIAALPSRHIRRLAINFAQCGLLLTVVCFPLSIAGMNLGLMIMAVGCLAAGAPLHRCVGFFCYLALFAVLAISLSQAWATKHVITAAIVPLGLIVAQIVFHPHLPHAEIIRRWAVRLLVAGIMLSFVVSVGQILIGRGDIKPFRIDPQGERQFLSSGLFSIHLTQGMVMGSLFFILMAVASASEKKIWRWSGIIGTMINIMLCGARSALFGFIFAISAWIMSRGKKYVLIGGISSVGLIVLAFGLMKWTQPERLEKMLALDDGRWPIWTTSLALIRENPWLGTGGPYAYREAYRDKYAPVNGNIYNEFPHGAPHAHNTQLAHASEYGIPYALLWLTLLGITLWHLRHADPLIFRAGVGMAVMAIVFGQFEKIDGESQRVLWTGLGMMLALKSNPGEHV
jgi:O-Antigen ligase